MTFSAGRRHPTRTLVKNQAQLAGLSASVIFQIARERVTTPRPTTLREVPPSPEYLTDEWLTRALCDATPGARVLSHHLGPRNDGTSARRTLRVHYNDAGTQADLPQFLFTKSSPTVTTRLVSAAASLGLIESSFYALVRPSLEIEAPTTRYSAYDARNYRQLLIVDDVAVTRGAVFATILERVATREQAEQLIDTLATLHAAYWNFPLGNMFGSWLPTSFEWMEALNRTINAAQRVAVGLERSRDVIPAELYTRRAEVHPALMRSLEINTAGPMTFLHGDVHPGNWYVAADGTMGLYDWQCSVRGGWARDIAYALASHLTIEDRRNWERDLVARHGERLAEAGIERPDPEDAFLAYRQQMLNALWMWIGTVGRHRLQPNMQPDSVAFETVRRTAQAVIDLDALDASTLDGRRGARPRPANRLISSEESLQ
jgi:aminoglycoside phosphotransferase (APT) family kinase protein